MGRLIPLSPILLFAWAGHAQELTHATLDSGGGRSTGGTISNDVTLGGIGGEMLDTTPLAARPGFAGQLWDPVGLAITPQPAAMSESSTLQLTAHLTGNDATTLPAPALTWETASPFLSVNATGLVSSTRLPDGQSASVTARSGDLSGSADISLFDLTPDDYGVFGGDGLEDGWQLLWFANDPGNAQPGDDPDSDGQDNRLEFLAGTSPLDGGSFLEVRIAPEPDRPAEQQLFFKPYRLDRIYTWEWSGTLLGPWLSVTGDLPAPQPSGETRSSDRDAVQVRKFYRLKIE